MKYCPGQEWNIALGNQWNLCHKFSGLETNICAGVCPEYITQVVATTPGGDYIPLDLKFHNSLDAFQEFYVNKYIDHHSHEIVY